MGATNDIANYVASGSYQNIPSSALGFAKLLFMDTLGVAVAGSNLPAATIAHDYAIKLGSNSAEKAHVVGLSMGGFATLHLGINAQDRVLSLVIAGCGYGAIPIDKTNFNKEADFSNISLDSAKIILNEGMDKFGSEYALGPSRVQFQNKDSKGWQLFNDQLIKHDPVGSANTLLGVQNKRPNLYSLEKEISGINCPTLIINGDEDDMCLEVGLYLKRTIKTAGLLIVPKTGHTINLEEPDLFNNHLLKFFTAVNSSSWGSRDKIAKIIKF